MQLCGSSEATLAVMEFFFSQSEYIAECDKRREFITGFTGSAGLNVLVLFSF